MNVLLFVLEVDPDSVRAGWIPLLIIIGIAVIIALLGWSMLHEIKKVKVPTRAQIAEADQARAAHGETSETPAETTQDH